MRPFKADPNVVLMGRLLLALRSTNRHLNQ